ncbi:hypothetical protein SAY86_018548 [Trapa natans]|uniref:ENT domain-containing protein n=1 Tax=Trapa natans TaxID=22666 RepID=A0AAN7LN52_TRANT|nr:hypothetical protein SAY86_018548 [Trapa natans]
MEYEILDSSGTDDDLPPSYQNRNPRAGRAVANGSRNIDSVGHSRMFGNMEIQIHSLEQEAYAAVLRAFKAQSDAISWDKESLITDLRRELRVSDEEHRELLSRVNADETIRRISIMLIGSGGTQEDTKMRCLVHLSPFMICYQVLQFPDLAKKQGHPNWSRAYPVCLRQSQFNTLHQVSQIAGSTTAVFLLSSQPIILLKGQKLSLAEKYGRDGLMTIAFTKQ